MPDYNELADIEFVDTDTGATVNALIQMYEKITGRTLYPADPARLFILWVADIFIQINTNINYSAQMNLLRYAKGIYLDSLADTFRSKPRLPPAAAKTTLRFTLSAPLESAVTIAKGTRATVDGKIDFATTEEITIAAGDTTGDAAAECVTVKEVDGVEITIGAEANGFAPGQINQLVDLFPYYESVTNTTTSEGGADEETDAAFYERIRSGFEAFSTAGPAGAYEYLAKSASALIVDVTAESPSDGVVDVRVLLKNGELPGTELLEEVTNALSARTVRPLTDKVTVSAPETVSYNIEFTYFLQSGIDTNAAAIASAVAAAVEDYKTWQSGKMGRDINPSRLQMILMQSGIKRVEIQSPVFADVPKTSVAVLAAPETIISGGYEDE